MVPYAVLRRLATVIEGGWEWDKSSATADAEAKEQRVVAYLEHLGLKSAYQPKPAIVQLLGLMEDPALRWWGGYAAGLNNRLVSRFGRQVTKHGYWVPLRPFIIPARETRAQKLGLWD